MLGVCASSGSAEYKLEAAVAMRNCLRLKGMVVSVLKMEKPRIFGYSAAFFVWWNFWSFLNTWPK